MAAAAQPRCPQQKRLRLLSLPQEGRMAPAQTAGWQRLGPRDERGPRNPEKAGHHGYFHPSLAAATGRGSANTRGRGRSPSNWSWTYPATGACASSRDCGHSARVTSGEPESTSVASQLMLIGMPHRTIPDTIAQFHLEAGDSTWLELALEDATGYTRYTVPTMTDGG